MVEGEREGGGGGREGGGEREGGVKGEKEGIKRGKEGKKGGNAGSVTEDMLGDAMHVNVSCLTRYAVVWGGSLSACMRHDLSTHQSNCTVIIKLFLYCSSYCCLVL